jgi:hypothetical protein
MHEAGPTRRAVLVGAGLLTVAACSSGTEPEPPKPDPDLPIRAVAAIGVRGLLALYDGVSRAHPRLRAELAPLAAETTAHLTALEPPQNRPTASSAPSTGSSTSPSTTTSPPVAVPATPAAARTALVRAERHEAGLRVTQLASASPALARLLAAIGASEATHATLLRGGS